MDNADDRLEDLVLYAWVGEDEFGSGEIGLKQALVPAGRVPLVSVALDKLDRREIRHQLQSIVDTFGKPMRLVRFKFAGTISTLKPRSPASSA